MVERKGYGIMLNIIITIEKNGMFKQMACDSNILTIEKAKDLVYEFKNRCVKNGIRFINALIKERSLSTLIK